MALGKLDSKCEGNKSWVLTPNAPQLKSENDKVLRRKHRETIFMTCELTMTLDEASEAQATKEEIDKLYFIQIKIFSASKGHYPDSERQPTE